MIPRRLIIAFSELGIKEINGDGSNARIDEYLKSVDQPSDDSIPWCSAYVNWVMRISGYKGTDNPAARSWLKWGVSCEPELGCIVVLKRGSSWQGHVGFYLNDEGNRIYILGGNQSNMVCVKSFLKSDVLDYRKQSQ